MKNPKLIPNALCHICGKPILPDDLWGWVRTKKPVRTLFFHMKCYKNLKKYNKNSIKKG